MEGVEAGHEHTCRNFGSLFASAGRRRILIALMAVLVTTVRNVDLIHY